MKHRKLMLLTVTTAWILCSTLIIQSPLARRLSKENLASAIGQNSNRAQEVLKQAREALGGEAKLKTIQSLSATAKYRRVIQGADTSGELEVEMLLPDKYIKNETMSMMGAEITRVEALSGDKAWADTRSGGSGMVVVRNAPPGADPKLAEAALRQRTREEFARILLGWLLTTPTTVPVEFSYVGEAEAPDGRADVIEAKGADNFTARLFFDQKTHRPLMLSYRGIPPQAGMRMSTMGGMDHAPSQEEIEKMRKEAQEKAAKEAEAMPKPKDSELQWRFSDYRNVNGISFPHHITKVTDNQVTEEWEMTKFKVNPSLKPEKFEKK